MQCGKVTSDWKLAEATTVYKKDLKSDRTNYRPVSSTNKCCKLLQSVQWDYIMRCVLESDLLSGKQYGFTERRSTILQLLQMTDKTAACNQFWEFCANRVDKIRGCVCFCRTWCDVSGAIKHVVSTQAGSEAADWFIAVTGLYAWWRPGTTTSVFHHYRVNDVSRSQM